MAQINKTPAAVKLAVVAAERHPDWYLFPLPAGAKSPPPTNMLNDGVRPPGATNDPAVIAKWGASRNVGIAPNASGLVFMDVDSKIGKRGQETFDALIAKHGPLPPTLTVRTPSGGLHYWFKETFVVQHRFGVNAFGPDVDCPQYVLTPGSVVIEDGKFIGRYTVIDKSPIAYAPDWFADYLQERVESPGIGDNGEPAVDLDLPENIQRAIFFLQNDAKPSIQGSGGEKALLDVGGVLKDLGISEREAVELIDEHYNVDGKCVPIWPLGELTTKVHNAFEYLKENQPGADGVLPDEDFGPDTKEREDQIRKVKALLDKTEESGCTPEEAKTSATAARRLMKLYGLSDDDLKDEPEIAVESYATLCAKWVYVVAQEVFVARERDALGEIYALSVPAFTKAYKFIAKREKLGGRYRNIVDHILNQTPGFPGAMARYTTFSYMPGKPEDYNGALNLWRPSDIVVPDKKPSTSTKWFHDHLEMLFTDSADREHVLNWMAGVYQNQELHPHHALLIHGRNTGTGKSVIKNTLSRLLGTSNCTEIDQKLLDNDFEKWKVRTKLLSVEEVRPAWGTSNAVLKNLHTLISEDRMPVNIKGKDDFQMTNVIAVLAGSNKDDALAIEDTERRWLILTTDRDGTLEPMPNEYYRAIYGRKGVGGLLNDVAALEALAYELMHRELGDYDIGGPAPRTQAKDKMAENAAHTIERWMMENAENVPLCLHVVTVEQILESMPSDVQRSEKDPRQRIGDVLTRKFKASKYRVRLHLDGSGDRAQTNVWVLHQLDIKVKVSSEAIEKLYKSERPKQTKAEKDAEVREFEEEDA
jgi:hypothetical protein